MLQRQRIQAVRHEARRRGELLSDSGNTSNRSTPRTPALVADTAPPYKPLEDDVVSASNVLVERDIGNSQATALHALDQNSKLNKLAVTAQVKDAMQAASAFTSDPPKLSAPHVSFAPQPRTSAERGSSNGITEIQQPVKAEPNAAEQTRMYENDDNAALATPQQQRSPDARRLFADDATHEDHATQNGTTTTTTTLLAIANASPSDSPFPAREGSTSDTPNPRLHNAFLTLRQHQQAGMHRVPLQGEGSNDAAMNNAGLATLPAELSNGYVHYTTSSSTAAAATGQIMPTQIPSILNMNGVSRLASGNILVPPISLAAAAMSNSASSPMQNGSPSSARRDSIARIENSLVQLQLELAKEKKHNLEAEQRIFALQREMEALRNENASLTQSLERYKRAYPNFTGTNNNNSEDNGNDAGQTTNNGSPIHNASTMPSGTQAMLSRMQTLEQHVTSLTELLQSKQAELDTKTERIRRLEHKLADTLLAAESPTRARMTTNADASVAAGSTRYPMSAITHNNNESVEGTSMTLLHPTFADTTPRITSNSNTLTGQTATMKASDMSAKMMSSPRKAEVTRTVTSARRGSNADNGNRNSTTTTTVLPSSARARNARRSSEAVVEPPSTRTSLAASSTTLVMSASAIPTTTSSAGVTKKEAVKEKKKASAMRPPTLNESALEMQPSRIAVQPASAMVGSARGHRGSLAQATVPHAVPHSTRCSASTVRRRPASPMKRSATNREYSLASTQHAAHEKTITTDKPHKAVHTVKHTGSTVKEVKQRQPLYAEEQGKEGGPAVRLSDEPESMPSEVASVSDIQSFPANSTTHAREFLIGSSRNRRRSTPQRTASATRTSAETGTTGTHPFTHHNTSTLEDSARRLSSARGLHNTSNNTGESEAVRPLSARRAGTIGASNSARRASSPAILQKRKSSTAGNHESGPFAPSSSVTVAMLEERPMLNNTTPLASLAQPPPRSMLACRRPSPARSVGVTTSVRLNTAMRARPQISYNAKEDATTIKGTTTTVVLRGATPSVGRSGSAALQRPPSRTSPARSASSHVRAETNASPLVAETYEATVNMNNEGTTMKAMPSRGSVSGQGETRLPRMDSSQSPGEETTLAMTRAGSSMEP